MVSRLVRPTCCNVQSTVSKKLIEADVTGPESAKLAILDIFDVFGYFPQTIQGADILSTSDEAHQYQVFMPDFFEGNPCDISWFASPPLSYLDILTKYRYPPVTDEHKNGIAEWFPSHTPELWIPRIPQIIATIEAKYGKKTWAALGVRRPCNTHLTSNLFQYCWGGKVVSVTSGPDTPFKVSAQCHAGLIAPEDAAKVTIPTCFLASKDESVEEVESYSKALTVEKHVETFQTQVHGWMSARGDLEDEECKKEYLRGYNTILDWFGKYID